MSVLVAVIVVVLLALAVWIVAGPLRGDAPTASMPAEDDRPMLEAAKEAKYREIRDAELDFRTGKLSVEDYHAVDRQLRAEAVEILRRLDELERR